MYSLLVAFCKKDGELNSFWLEDCLEADAESSKHNIRESISMFISLYPFYAAIITDSLANETNLRKESLGEERTEKV